jgi:hypothetical protein
MSADGTHPEIPESNKENPFKDGTFLNDIFGKVLKENRDIIMIVTDHRGRRGTGKTIASLNMASNLDQTEEGLVFSKCSLDVEEIRNAYTSQPPGSALVLDEIEQAAGNRDAMTVTNRALREIMAMGRVEQKYVICNVPIKGFVDTDILKLCDVWISMTRRGRGLVHHLKWEPYMEKLFTEKKQWMEFQDIDQGTQLRKVYNKLSREKRNRISGEEGKKFLPLEEHEHELKMARKDARKDMRDELVTGVYENPEIDVTQQELADAIGVAQKTISNITRGET